MNQAAEAATGTTPPQYQLRSHEKSAGGINVEATYTILRDGKPLGFSEHCDAIARLNDMEKALRVLLQQVPTMGRP